jgi:hypothetical protein
MELPDAALKNGAAGKWQHFQKDFFYRLVEAVGKGRNIAIIRASWAVL